MISEFDINTIVNYLFAGTVAWIRSIEIRLRHVPAQTIEVVENYSDKLSHRIDRLEDRLERLTEKTQSEP